MLGTRQRSVRACGALAPATPVLGAPQARRSLSPLPLALKAFASSSAIWKLNCHITESFENGIT